MTHSMMNIGAEAVLRDILGMWVVVSERINAIGAIQSASSQARASPALAWSK